MGSENEKRQMALELNGEFIGLAEGFAPVQIAPQEQVADGSLRIEGTEFSFTLHPTKKFMRKFRWLMLKQDLADFIKSFFPRRRG